MEMSGFPKYQYPNYMKIYQISSIRTSCSYLKYIHEKKKTSQQSSCHHNYQESSTTTAAWSDLCKSWPQNQRNVCASAHGRGGLQTDGGCLWQWLTVAWLPDSTLGTQTQTVDSPELLRSTGTCCTSSPSQRYGGTGLESNIEHDKQCYNNR